MPVTLGLAGAGVLVGGVQSILGASQASKAKKNLINEINNQSLYQPSEYAQRSLAEAQARENAKAAAVTYGEKMAMSGLANAQANVARNAASGSQALAMGASNMGQYNQALMDLGQVQNQFQQQGIQNTAAARNLMIGEGDKAFASLRAKQDALQNLYAGQLGAGNAMLGQGLGTVASGLIGAAGAYKGGTGEIGKAVNMDSIPSKTNIPNFNVPIGGPTMAKSTLKTTPTSSLMSSAEGLNSNLFNSQNTNLPSFTPMKTNYPTFNSGAFNWW
jgi:hypothetical protein